MNVKIVDGILSVNDVEIGEVEQGVIQKLLKPLDNAFTKEAKDMVIRTNEEGMVTIGMWDVNGKYTKVYISKYSQKTKYYNRVINKFRRLL